MNTRKYPDECPVFQYGNKLVEAFEPVEASELLSHERVFGLEGRYVDSGCVGIWTPAIVEEYGFVPLTPAAEELLAIVNELNGG